MGLGYVATQRRLGLFILACCSLFFAIRGFYSQANYIQARDFKPPYAAARCLLHGENPYDDDTLRREFVQADGDMRDIVPMAPHYLLYPPPAILLVVPFALFKWPIAHLLFLGLSAALLIMASFVAADMCLPNSSLLFPALISLFLLGANQLMITAQPAGPAIGLCVIAVLFLLQGKHTWLAVLLFSLSLTLKPHLGAFIWLYLFISHRFRTQAIAIAAITILLCLPAVLWLSVMPASAHWLQQLTLNLRLTEMKGSLSDPGPGNSFAYYLTTLQTIAALVRDERPFYNAVSWIISGMLFLFWLGGVRKTPASLDRDIFALAAISCLSMLPIYHRAYDTKLLLLCFPAIAIVYRRACVRWKVATAVSESRKPAWQALGWSSLAAALIVLIENDRYNFKLYGSMPGPDPDHLVKTILLLRNIPVIMLAMTLLFLFLLWNLSSRESPGMPAHRESA